MILIVIRRLRESTTHSIAYESFFGYNKGVHIFISVYKKKLLVAMYKIDQ